MAAGRSIGSSGNRATSALPLAVLYAALVVYASLYPFAGWRDQGIAPWAFLASPWPRYWTGFDLTANLLGYMPLGALLALALLRSGAGTAAAVASGALAAATLSLALEAVQSYLPSRVASNLDFGLNALGALLGAFAVAMLQRMGWLMRWNRLRDLWFEPDARGAMVLLLVWPLALLFPPAVPFGLGHMMERAEAALGNWLGNTPFLDWIPMREVELQPLWPATEAMCVSLGLLAPLLLVCCAARTPLRRAVLALLVAAAGVLASALSAALTWGPAHAWAWIDPPVTAGALAALAATVLLVWAPRRVCGALLLMVLAAQLVLLNQAPASPYFAQTLQTWEQGRFIRFHGLAQWLGWLWPPAVIAYLLAWISRREAKPRIRA
ncbi:MAG: hypothetical protein RL087_1456 [Pseudomonadota bacterium]